jgi:hypothetical protein
MLSNIQNNVRLCPLQYEIGGSDVRLNLIMLIMDMGLSAHLWQSLVIKKIYADKTKIMMDRLTLS